MVFPGNLLIILAVFAGLVWLQVILSKKENRWLGLILPMVSFVISLLVVSGVFLYSTFSFTTHTTTQQRDDDGNTVIQQVENGQVLSQQVIDDKGNILLDQKLQQTSSLGSLVMTACYLFLLYNLPTGLFLLIYFGCRKQRRQRAQLDKMQIQDLE